MSVTELSHYQFVRVSGAENRSFLQGQLSCNMDDLSSTASLRAAICNLKGRVVADMRVLLDGEDVLLQTSDGSAAAIIQVLGKYAVFSKVEIAEDDTGLAVLGIIGETSLYKLLDSEQAIADSDDQVIKLASGYLVQLGGSKRRFEIWADNQESAQALLAVLPPATLHVWQHAEISDGIFHISTETSEAYTPQLLNYDVSGVINFSKGCYTGQEVVARMFYRGKAKKRLYAISSTIELANDDQVFVVTEENKREGEILSLANAEQSVMLAILSTEVETENGKENVKLELHEKPEARLSLLPLPYLPLS